MRVGAWLPRTMPATSMSYTSCDVASTQKMPSYANRCVETYVVMRGGSPAAVWATQHKRIVGRDTAMTATLPQPLQLYRTFPQAALQLVLLDLCDLQQTKSRAAHRLEVTAGSPAPPGCGPPAPTHLQLRCGQLLDRGLLAGKGRPDAHDDPKLGDGVDGSHRGCARQQLLGDNGLPLTR